jgi:hypothetical protein
MLEGDARKDPAERIAEARARAARSRATAQPQARATAMPRNGPRATPAQRQRPATTVGDAVSRRDRTQARGHGGIPLPVRDASIPDPPSNRDATAPNALIALERLA